MVIPGLQGMSLKSFFRAVGKAIWRDGVTDLAAQLAYYGLLSLFPFAIFLVTILGFIPIQGLAEQIFEVVHRVMPSEAADMFEKTVRGVVYVKRGWLLWLSLAGAVFTASGGVGSLVTSLDRAYGVTETRSWWKLKLTSMILTVVAAVLIVIASAALILGPEFARTVSNWFGLTRLFETAWNLLRWPVTLFAMSTLLAFLYWACPNVKQKFKYLTPGSIVGVVLWVAASVAFNYYAEKLGNYNKTYGALGAGIALLTWIYLSSLIVLIGGVMNAVIWCASHPGATKGVGACEPEEITKGERHTPGEPVIA